MGVFLWIEDPDPDPIFSQNPDPGDPKRQDPTES